MIKGHGQVQVFTDLDAPIYHAWFLGDTTQRHVKRVSRQGNSPAAPVTKHPNGRHQYCAGPFFLQARLLLPYPVKQRPDETRQVCKLAN